MNVSLLVIRCCAAVRTITAGCHPRRIKYKMLLNTENPTIYYFRCYFVSVQFYDSTHKYFLANLVNIAQKRVMLIRQLATKICLTH